MAMSGVELDPECKQSYDETLMGHMFRYVTFKIDDGKVRIDKVMTFTVFSSFPTVWLWLPWSRHEFIFASKCW